jgi:hypothetical protein
VKRSARRRTPTGDLLYSHDFSTVFGEWKTTEEANKISRGFKRTRAFLQ